MAASEDTSTNYFKILLNPSRVKQGQSFTVFVDSAGPLQSLKLNGLNRKLHIYRIWHKNHKYLYRSFIGVPATQKPGKYVIAAEAQDANKESIRIYSTLQVTNANFNVQRINLPAKKVSLLNAKNLNEEGSILGRKLAVRSLRVYFASHFIKPARGRISSPFGARRKYNNDLFSSYHKGIDIANARGTPVKASNGGQVSLAMTMKSNGKIILINHGHGISTIYSHLNAIKVKTGQWVKQGEVIGLIGSTGISTGPHLHFGFSVNNVRVDPEQWLSSQTALYYNSSNQ